MQNIKVQTQAKEIPVHGRSDIVVVSAGIAGIADAIAAARNGKSVTLLEKPIVLGSLATAGHVCIYLPLDDGLGHRIFGDLAEELLHTSIKYSYNTLVPQWHYGIKEDKDPEDWYQTHFNIPAGVMAFDELLEEVGVHVVFDTLFSEPIMEGDTCKRVIVDTKEGRVAYLADAVIDASGDADVMYRADAVCEENASIVSHWDL